MPREQLTREQRLEQLVTRLKNINQRYKQTIKDLQGIVKHQEQRIMALEEKLQNKEAQRKQLLGFLYKPNKTTQDKKKRGKKPGSKGYQRPKPKKAEVTESREFLLTECPCCQNPFAKPTETVVKYEEDIDLAPRKIIREFVIGRYFCSKCQEFFRSPHIPPITRIGPNVMGYLLYARYHLRMPINKIQESLKDLHNFQLSQGEIAEKFQEAESLFNKDYQSICELVKEATVVYADETGWRMQGKNWWLWVFATPKGIRYVLSDTRGGGIAKEALGENPDRVIISDGYKVYEKLAGDKQQCWVHLLRLAKQASLSLYYEFKGRI